MAKGQSTSKTAVKETPKPSTQELIAKTQKELKAVGDQVSGLQIFLKALSESQGSSVIYLYDLTFGFCYLLDATERGIEHTKSPIERAMESK